MTFEIVAKIKKASFITGASDCLITVFSLGCIVLDILSIIADSNCKILMIIWYSIGIGIEAIFIFFVIFELVRVIQKTIYYIEHPFKAVFTFGNVFVLFDLPTWYDKTRLGFGILGILYLIGGIIGEVVANTHGDQCSPIFRGYVYIIFSLWCVCCILLIATPYVVKAICTKQPKIQHYFKSKYKTCITIYWPSLVNYLERKIKDLIICVANFETKTSFSFYKKKFFFVDINFERIRNSKFITPGIDLKIINSKANNFY